MKRKIPTFARNQTPDIQPVASHLSPLLTTIPMIFMAMQLSQGQLFFIFIPHSDWWKNSYPCF
jgi:hypothetical protein